MNDSANKPAMHQLHFVKPIPVKHMREAGGYLPNTVEACALWQFLIMAFQALDRVEKQVTYVGDEDQQVDLMQLATSSQKIYELDTLEGMFAQPLIEAARMEAFRSALPWDTRIDAWFATGGKSYRILDRDADKVGL